MDRIEIPVCKVSFYKYISFVKSKGFQIKECHKGDNIKYFAVDGEIEDKIAFKSHKESNKKNKFYIVIEYHKARIE